MKRRLKRLAGWIAAAALAGVLLVASCAAFVWHRQPFPFERLECWPVSPRVTDREGAPLLQIVGEDDQWRYPVPLTDISPWLIKATIAAEDERFNEHAGVDTVALLRAVLQNVDAGEVVSGASTLTMQLCRMTDEQPRTFRSKFVEAVRALQVEQRLSKNAIIESYLNVAPYGGNVRGVEAAATKYFGKPARELSLGEAALLAGITQSPNRFRPDRFVQAASRRRDYVLLRLRETGIITASQERVARSESVEALIAVGQRRASTANAHHAAWMALRQRPAGGCTTIDATLQELCEARTAERLAALPTGADAAVVVIDIASSEIVSLVGSGDPDDPVDGQVNGALAQRSPGSTLKPFLYAAAFEARRLNGESTVFDGPVERAGWRPDNFDRQFRGPMRVADALRESRNVPAILVTEAIGASRCVGLLEAVGVSLRRDAVARGGLAIAVGAVETTLLDLTNAYATLGRNGQHTEPRLFSNDGDRHDIEPRVALSASVSSVLNDILSTRHRIPRGMEDTPADHIPWFMWKTGTSSGRRDAWAVGHNGRFAIGVWIGNFSGAGHPAFVGAEAAEPLLATLFTSDALRNDSPPPEPETLLVTQPLNLLPAAAAGPVITAPSDRVALVCIDSQAVHVPVSATNAGDAVWFLNRRPVPNERLADLKLARGSYELRCTDPAGRSDCVRFTIE